MELANTMNGRRVNVVYLQETKWQSGNGYKANELSVGLKLYYLKKDNDDDNQYLKQEAVWNQLSISFKYI